MAWAPTRAVLNPQAIPENLVGYCLDATRQADALTWAGGTGYKPVKTFQNSLVERSKPVYPSTAFSDDNDAQGFDSDVITGAYSYTFELSIQNADADTAVEQARVYTKAFRSMIVNCPAPVLAANTGAIEGNCFVQTIETGFLAIRAHMERKNDFLQVVQIRVTVVLAGQARI